MMETFQPPYRIRYNNAITVRYSPYTSEWRISNKSATGFGDIMATETTVPAGPMLTRFWKTP